MLVKLLFLLLIILIVIFLIIFSESIHVSVIFNYLNNSMDGQIIIKYYFINYIKDFNNNVTKLVISTRLFSKEFVLNNNEEESESTSENNSDDKEREDENSEISSEKGNFKNILNLIKRYYPDISVLKQDIIEIIVSFKDIFFIDDNYLNINLGLTDNNLTIKICTFLWSLSAIFYPMGLNILIKPIINETKLEVQSNLKFDISLLLVLKILFKILFNIKLIKLLISIYKEMN